MGITLLKV